jgi:hypothetical protein
MRSQASELLQRRAFQHICVALALRMTEQNAGNKYENDTLVDLFLSSLSNSDHEYYSSFLSTLKFQWAETKSIPFASLEQCFLQLKERHALCGSAR